MCRSKLFKHHKKVSIEFNVSLLLALLATLFIVHFALRRIRTAKFFTSMLDTIDLENRMISNILSDPYLFYWYSQLEADFFSSKIMQNAYKELYTYYRKIVWYPSDEGFNSFKEANNWLATIRLENKISKEEVTSIFKRAALKTGQNLPEPKESSDRDNSEMNQELIYGLENKKDKNMLSTVVKEENGDIFTYRRIMKKYPKSLYALTTTLSFLGFYSFFHLATLRYSEESLLTQILIFTTLALLMLSSLSWAIVDMYTMYLDYEFFKLSCAITSIPLFLSFALLKGSNQEKITLFIKTLLVPIGILLFMWVILFLFKRIKGLDGMGLGDFYIIFPVILIPLLYLNDLRFAFHAFMLSNLLGILGWLVLRVQGKLKSSKDPFAFGPYLATGWIITLFIYTLSGLPIYS